MSYDRPNQPWICGHSDEGNPCPLGPSRLGVCQHTGDCHPVELNGQWQCNRSKLNGGPCDHGPNNEGECGVHRERCTPKASLRKRRGIFVAGCFGAAIALVAIMLATPWRIEALAPGPLTHAHAQILNRKSTENRCSACHAAGDESLSDWLVPANWRHPEGNEPVARSQAGLCLHCHDKSFDRLTALSPHGLSFAELEGLTQKAKKRSGLTNVSNDRLDLSADLACSVCHREHHGAMHNLSALSNIQCSTCHTDDFHRFDSHPEFVNWPHRGRTRIDFDHASHQFKHFTKDNKAFDCKACHLESNGRVVTSVVSFESCRSCHESGIVSPASNGIAFFLLPTLDMGAFADAGINVGVWPEIATGDFDGLLPPTMRMLLATDPQANHALKQFDEPFDFFDVDPTDRKQLTHAAEIVFGIKRLMQRLAFPASSDEIPTTEIADSIRDIEQSIPAFVIESAVEKWMKPIGRAAADAADVNSSLDGGNQQPSVAHAAYLQADEAVGWFRDDEGMTIGYRPMRHDDPVMQTLYDTLSAKSHVLGEGASALFTSLQSPTATGQCASCHTLEQDGAASRVNWLAHQTETARQFTKFSHTPHLLQAELQDCSACHALNLDPDVTTDQNADELDSHVGAHAGDFHHISKMACSKCHTPTAAGDSCLKCHNYHIDSPHRAIEPDVADRHRIPDAASRR